MVSLAEEARQTMRRTIEPGIRRCRSMIAVVVVDGDFVCVYWADELSLATKIPENANPSKSCAIKDDVLCRG